MLLFWILIGNPLIRVYIIGETVIILLLVIFIVFGGLALMFFFRLNIEVSLKRWLQVPFYAQEWRGRLFLNWGFGQRVAQEPYRQSIHFKVFTKHYKDEDWRWLTTEELKKR